MDLAGPIAEKGATAIPFLLTQLDSKADDLAIRDILMLFATMAHSKNYDVKSDKTLMTMLTSKVSGMKDKEWQGICSKMLERINEEQKREQAAGVGLGLP